MTNARSTAAAANADARNDAFLGGNARRRIAPAALQFLPEDLFPAAAVLPGMRLVRRRGVPRQRQGAALLLCGPPPAGAGLYPAIGDRGHRTRRGPTDDDQHRRLPADAGGAGSRHAGRGCVREARRRGYAAAVQAGETVVPQFEISLVIPGPGRSPGARNPGTQAPVVLGKIGVHGFRALAFGRPRNDSPVYCIQTESLPAPDHACARGTRPGTMPNFFASPDD